MAATNLADLHNFEVHFESAAETFLNTATGIQTVGTVSETVLQTPRTECQFQLEGGTSPPILHGDGAAPNTEDFSEYEGLFLVRVITDNAVGQAANHATYRSQIRSALLYSAANWDATTLPYYGIKWLQPTTCTYLTDADFNVTELSWAVRFEIRTNAWPD
jgi:hypothetical protein